MTDVLVWIFINLISPVAAPIAGMWLEQRSASGIRDPIRREAALRTRKIIMLVKDGQLGWSGLLMSFGTMSDLIDGIRRHGLPGFVAMTLVASLVLACLNGYFATRGAADNVEVLDAFSWKKLGSDYPTAYGTIYTVFLAALFFSVAHFWAL